MSLYSQLMTLCREQDGAFFYSDSQIDENSFYRIFNYRLSSYSQFLLPGALEARGVMFLVRDHGWYKDPEIVCRPMEKFFNLGENPFTSYTIEDVIANTECLMDKADGSLISSFINHDNKLKLKSKGSLISDQALDAMIWIGDHPTLYSAVEDYTRAGYTVNMEWVGPDNRIVLGYDSSKLIVLNIRDNLSGEYTDMSLIPDEYKVDIYEQADFILDYKDQEGFEGYIVRLRTGQHVKLKTDWYVTRHHCKDSVNTPRKLLEAVIDDATDDIKQMFQSDEGALLLINEMESLVIPWYDHFVNRCTTFYNDHKHLERKDFAILGQQFLDNHEFGATMQLYVGRTPDWKVIAKKNYKLIIGDSDND